MRERLVRAGTVDYARLERNTEKSLHHRNRELVTAGLVAWPRPETVLDPACGEGNILCWANLIHPFRGIMTDLSEPNVLHVKSRVPPSWTVYSSDLVDAIRRSDQVDMIVLTEILEHLEDPDAILRLARRHARLLVASSPEMRPGQVDDNPEHLWQFDGDGYFEMLTDAGWQTYSKTHLAFRPRMYQEGDSLMVEVDQYSFQVWVCGHG